jgi:hypothetical protein
MAEATSSWVGELDDRISGPLKDVMNRAERLEKQRGTSYERANKLVRPTLRFRRRSCNAGGDSGVGFARTKRFHEEPAILYLR